MKSNNTRSLAVSRLSAAISELRTILEKLSRTEIQGETAIALESLQQLIGKNLPFGPLIINIVGGRARTFYSELSDIEDCARSLESAASHFPCHMLESGEIHPKLAVKCFVDAIRKRTGTMYIMLANEDKAEVSK